MLRRFIIYTVTFLFVLQGAVQASMPLAGAEPPAQHHCDGHENAPQDCPCCPDGVALSGGCMNACLAVSMLPVTALILDPTETIEHSRIEISGAPGPSYAPFKPPPIA
jgi:hypothetical protein